MTPPTAAVTEESTSHFAVVAADYGGPEVLSVVDAEVPPPGPGEATIEVRAAGVNPIDRKLYSGAFGSSRRQPAGAPGTRGRRSDYRGGAGCGRPGRVRCRSVTRSSPIRPQAATPPPSRCRRTRLCPSPPNCPGSRHRACCSSAQPPCTPWRWPRSARATLCWSTADPARWACSPYNWPSPLGDGGCHRQRAKSNATA